MKCEASLEDIVQFLESRLGPRPARDSARTIFWIRNSCLRRGKRPNIHATSYREMQTDNSSLAIRKLDYAPLRQESRSERCTSDKVEKRRNLTARRAL